MEDKKMCCITMDGDSPIIMCLSDDQIKVFEWLRNKGYDFQIEIQRKAIVLWLAYSVGQIIGMELADPDEPEYE